MQAGAFYCEAVKNDRKCGPFMCWSLHTRSFSSCKVFTQACLFPLCGCACQKAVGQIFCSTGDNWTTSTGVEQWRPPGFCFIVKSHDVSHWCSFYLSLNHHVNSFYMFMWNKCKINPDHENVELCGFVFLLWGNCIKQQNHTACIQFFTYSKNLCSCMVTDCSCNCQAVIKSSV